MKEVLEQLLRAEEAGRRAAASREAEGERLVTEAEAESARITERAREALARRIEALGAEIRADTDAELQAVAEEREREIARCRAQTDERRPVALRQLLAMLLNEAPGVGGGE